MKYATIEYLHWTNSGTGLTVPVLKSVIIPTLEEFQAFSTGVMMTGYFLDQNTLIPPNAMVRIRRTDHKGYTVNAAGQRVVNV